jgi:pyruvate/2-oxoglutarate/acetoin dehydrogenase E1 component
MTLYIEAIRAALRDALLEDERVFLLGEASGTSAVRSA